ncbi:MAG: AAA family ATPase [Desulfuromonadales bacterium]|nr:AAA family ATPase [Desulfuromonadales bacterium]
MILRRITLERYGCFGSAEFEFRRGMNLINGGNESGKSLLLAALPAALLGVEHGSRLRSWGDTLNCRVTVLFEGGEAGVRLARDLESNLVRLEESGTDGSWRECFAGKVPPAAETPERADYLGHLERLFSVRGEPLLRALIDAAHADAVLTDDGRLAKGLVAADSSADLSAPTPVIEVVDPELRQKEIATLEEELAVDRDEYLKGKEYLAWIRKRWEHEGKKSSKAAKTSDSKSAARHEASLERKRDELLAKLNEQGLPTRLPADLPAMFNTAEGLRQELAALQLELTPLLRRKPTIVMPGFVWPLLTTLLGVAAPGAAFWQKLPWWLPLSVGCGVVLLVVWGFFIVRLNRARTERDLLDQQIQAVEIKRADALSRQNELAEQFETYGLPSAPVEMVKLQQLCRRNEDLLNRYYDICDQLGEGAAAPAAGKEGGRDKHLQPEELPEAEARLAELGESLRRREARLAALRDGSADVPAADRATPRSQPAWTEKQWLQAIGQHLERLTAGRHREVRLEEGQLRLEAAPGRWAAPGSCSRGINEALALAVRLACAQMLGGALPLLIDNLPVHLDAKRQQAALHDLERFAADHQLLLTGCDEELAKRGIRERWQVIKLKMSVPEKSVAKEEESDAGQLHLL